MVKKLFWYDTANVGDALNPYIQCGFGIDAVTCGGAECDFAALGSLLEQLLVNGTDKNFDGGAAIDIWGTGFLDAFSAPRHFEDVKVPEEFIRPLAVHALRGQSSLARYKKIMGGGNIDLSKIVLGDPGILCSRIFPRELYSKRKRNGKDRVGIVFHYYENRDKIIKRLKKSIPNSVVINVINTPIKFIKKILRCDVVLSSALHPLVIADSYGIPNRWINLSGGQKVSMQKFTDYYSVYGLEAEYIDLNKETVTAALINEIKDSYKITREMLNTVSEKLIAAHPYSNTIRPVTKKEIKRIDKHVKRKKTAFLKEKIYKFAKAVLMR